MVRLFGRFSAALCGTTIIATGLVATASASQLIDRDATSIRLKATKTGVAQLIYRSGGRAKKVMAWGALNATFPAPGAKQQLFTVNFANGHGTPYAKLAANFPNACTRYDGPKLPWVVAACRVPDGSYWVLQSWHRALPNWGAAIRPSEDHTELRLSHYKGELPVFTVKQDWVQQGRYEHFYGSLVYLGHPLYGFKTDRFGAPLDKFGVLIYLDTFNSPYGAGWKRENSFVTHKTGGVFCYQLTEHTYRGKPRPIGKGSKYRMTVQSPGALPDLYWGGRNAGAFNEAKDDAANEEQRTKFQSGDCTIS